MAAPRSNNNMRVASHAAVVSAGHGGAVLQVHGEAPRAELSEAQARPDGLCGAERCCTTRDKQP